MWIYVDDGIIDPEEIIAKPGALIPVKDPNNIQPLHPDSTVAISYNEIAQLKAEYQEVTGATKYFTGGPTGDLTKTATEVAALQSAGVIRFSEVIQNLEQNALKPAINLILDYNKKFNVLAKSIKMTENSTSHFLGMDHAGFMQDLKLKITGANSSISKDIKIRKLMEFIQMIASSPVLAQQINIMEMIKQLYRELGFKDESNVF